MSLTSRRRPRYAVGCALAAIAASLASPVWADPAPTYAQLLAQLGDAPATLEAGANYYLTKGSFHDESLLDAVRDLIGGPG